MRHYYAVIDHENQSYGIALSVGSKGYITDRFAPTLEIFAVFVSVLSFLLLTIGAAFAMAKIRQVRWEKKLRTMRDMNDPNYFMRDAESLVSQSFGSKRGSFARMSNRNVKASFTNEFAYQ